MSRSGHFFLLTTTTTTTELITPCTRTLGNDAQHFWGSITAQFPNRIVQEIYTIQWTNETNRRLCWVFILESSVHYDSFGLVWHVRPYHAKLWSASYKIQTWSMAPAKHHKGHSPYPCCYMKLQNRCQECNSSQLFSLIGPYEYTRWASHLNGRPLAQRGLNKSQSSLWASWKLSKLLYLAQIRLQ